MNTIDRVLAYNAGREQERFQMKFSVMQADPFVFMRNLSFILRRLAQSLNKLNSPNVWVCGDLHLVCGS